MNPRPKKSVSHVHATARQIYHGDTGADFGNQGGAARNRPVPVCFECNLLRTGLKCQRRKRITFWPPNSYLGSLSYR
jgi:hypothetical protein